MEQPLVDKEYQLIKQPGKGGWTYIVITEIKRAEHTWFGLVRVNGTIDNYELKSYNLMSMGKGKLFLPVKAEIRKKIKKGEGDWVRLILYTDNLLLDIPEELLLCLADEPVAHQNFLAFSEVEQRQFINWIYSAKTDESKVERIAETVNMALLGQKMGRKK